MDGFHIKLDTITGTNSLSKYKKERTPWEWEHQFHIALFITFKGKGRNLQALAILLGLKDSAEEDDTKNKTEQQNPYKQNRTERKKSNRLWKEKRADLEKKSCAICLLRFRFWLKTVSRSEMGKEQKQKKITEFVSLRFVVHLTSIEFGFLPTEPVRAVRFCWKGPGSSRSPKKKMIETICCFSWYNFLLFGGWNVVFQFQFG